MRRGVRVLAGNWRMPPDYSSVFGKETLSKVTEAAGAAKTLVNDISDTATQVAIDKAWTALDLATKRREKSNYCVDVTVSVTVGPAQITLTSPDECAQGHEDHD